MITSTRTNKASLLLLLSCIFASSFEDDLRSDESLYNIGVGIHDATGPIAGVNMMGYANPSQINNGIHTRLFARSFIVDDGERRLVFVSLDCGMMAQVVKRKVIERLQETFNSTYTWQNVMLSGTHTHSGPAGFLQYLLFDITSLGFVDETYDAMVEGVYQSIVRAHNSIRPGRIWLSSGRLDGASANRSPTAYEHNPENEKKEFGANTDNQMTLLRFVDTDSHDMGMLNWFAVHATSMNNTNTLVSGDNKGVASQIFEKHMNGPDAMPGQGSFVAAFAQGNCGDISPNTAGAKCQDTGLPCDADKSTCNGHSHLCVAAGPGKDMFESTKIIAQKQVDKAEELYFENNITESVLLSGPVQFAQQFIDMANYTVQLPNGTKVQTCEAALGFSFAAGTTDGPGEFDFTQGMTEPNPFWNIIVDRIVPARPAQQACHAPKPILLDTGNYNEPYPWHPRIMDTQIGRVGQLFMAAIPGEMTTMAGRRIKRAVSKIANELGVTSPTAVIAGLSNEYSHYITTFEEYAVQRYEGASTIFGPHTLDAYLQQYSKLTDAMIQSTFLEEGPSPPDLYDAQIRLLPGVLYDRASSERGFGHVIAQPFPLVYQGQTQMAIFVSGHPRNVVELGSSFLDVEKQMNKTYWQVVATDASWETRFVWESFSVAMGTSEATCFWDVPSDAPAGTYRIRHAGRAKDWASGQTKAYQGVTEAFTVKARAKL